MRKTRLSPDTLQVETFETEAAASAIRGTVHAHATDFTSYCQCINPTWYGTCQESCVDTCGGPTCELPCEYPDTMYMTCQAGCSWTDGDHVCLEPQTDVC